MSRSRKKVPGFITKSAYGKEQANRRVRHTKYLSSFGCYKKVYDSWNIRDWRLLYFSALEVKQADYEKYKLYLK